MRKNDAFDAKIVNMRLTKIFIAIFAPEERLPSSATLRGVILAFLAQIFSASKTTGAYFFYKPHIWVVLEM